MFDLPLDWLRRCDRLQGHGIDGKPSRHDLRGLPRGGQRHVVAAKPFIGKKLTPEQDKEVRGTIYKVMPGNVCMRCHTEAAHKAHPAYDK